MKKTNKVDEITFEKKIIKTITVTSESIKDYKVLSSFLEHKCEIVTKKSPNRPWLYIKCADTLKTIGGVRLNKNSIGTFYIDTNPGIFLNESSMGIISKELKNYISNRIIVNDLQSLERVCDLITELMESGAVYKGKRS
ncbi:hypothetical protein [Priestia aryabhattai]|uniref:hypothetical protein n=1 Tax=Priestia aryabhattai TaxID=412384 RepID=UPI002E1ECAC7|nr:hypothetical protein [Priestia aryabhattai]